jgi:hypothetical protein
MTQYDDDINWDDVDDSKDVDPGTYLLKLETIERMATKDGDREFVGATFVVLDAADASLEKSIGGKVFDNFSLTEKALWKLKTFAKAIDEDIVKGKTSLDAVIAAMQNQMLVANAEIDTYQGRQNIRLKRPKGAEGWDGLHFRVERGELIGEAPADNGKSKKAAKPAASKSKHTTVNAEDEVDL